MKLKPFTYSLATLLTGSLLGSCWHEDLSRCWKGDVVLSVTAGRSLRSRLRLPDREPPVLPV